MSQIRDFFYRKIYSVDTYAVSHVSQWKLASAEHKEGERSTRSKYLAAWREFQTGEIIEYIIFVYVIGTNKTKTIKTIQIWLISLA